MTQAYTRTLITPPLDRSSVYRAMSPEGQRPGIQTSYYQDRQYEGSSWRREQPHSPPSDSRRGLYEIAPAKSGNMYHTPAEAISKTPREQLPPLSSLFSSTSHQGRPLQSPYSDSHSPNFPLPSPIDARPPATPIHPLDRPYDAAYPPRRPLSRGYSQLSRPEQVERLGIQPPPAPRAPRPGNGQESPRYTSAFSLDSSRAQIPPPSAHTWSPRPQINRSDYFPRDTSSSFRTHSDFQASTSHRPESESRSIYRDISHNAGPNYPPTPASTISGDATTKDSLGPKIWTGTQFLPRFVRQADVPGEGMCYFYDDGTHCKTVIDGEAVNAHWGVTKAGKPRKRLAIACITCREKKIKCDPDYPRCVQCEKFGRICKFKNAPRGGQVSPDTPPADLEDTVSRPGSSRAAEPEIFQVEKRENSHSVSPRQPPHSTPDSESHHAKRQRTGYSGFSPVASEASPRLVAHGTGSPQNAWNDPLDNMLLDQSNIIREWHTNPYQTDPTLVTDLVSVLLKHVPETAYCIFPEAPFKAWILSTSEKSLDDLMLIYTVLAFGTVFSLVPEHRCLGPRFAAISRYACSNRKFTIQLVQSRLFLALYLFANNDPTGAWDFCGGAMRAASGLRLNVEIEKSEDAYLKTFPYGLNRAGYAECRRRTFWSCYMMDRFNGFCSGHLSVINPEDIFLRLPCDVNSFEAQSDVQNAFFDPFNPSIKNTNWTVGSMAYLINIATIWGDAMAYVYRAAQRTGPPPSPPTFPTHYENITRRLMAWKESLPSIYMFSAENLTRASSNAMLSTFVTMHAAYHTTAMKLNRYIQHSTLTTAQLTHHLSVAKHHAESLLNMMDLLATRRPATSPAHIGIAARPSNFASPFAGYAIVSAVDILSAKLPLAAIPSRVASFNGSESVLAELALFWQSSKNQQALVAQRIRDLAEISGTGREVQGSGGVLAYKFGAIGGMGRDGNFEMRDAIEKTFTRDIDCIYA